MREFNTKVVLPFVLMLVGIVLLFILATYLFNDPLEWDSDMILFIPLLVNFGLFYTSRKKILVSLLQFLESEQPDFNFFPTGKMMECISLQDSYISFAHLEEALQHTDFTMHYADELHGIIKLKQDLKTFTNSNAVAIELQDDEVIVRCYSFSGRVHKDTKSLCREVLALIEVLKIPESSKVAI